MINFDNSQDFNKLINDNNFIIFDFSLKNCPRCEILKNNLSKLDSNILVYYVQVEDNMKLVRKLNIYASPCIQIYFNSKLVYRNLGTFNFDEVINIINEYNK